MSEMIVVLYLIASIATGLTYLVYASPLCKGDAALQLNGSQCELGRGGTINIGAAACYFVAGLLVCCTPKPTESVCCGKNEQQDGDDVDSKKGTDDAGNATSDEDPVVSVEDQQLDDKKEFDTVGMSKSETPPWTAVTGTSKTESY